MGPGGAMLLVAPPRAGKTEYAFATLLRGLETFGMQGAVMAVSGRTAADRLSNRVIRHMGASTQVRPVTTLAAIAFRAISAARARAGLSAPRLLNGAEQDALLRQVVAVHLGHAAAGDDCPTCALLRGYFAQRAWSTLITEASAVPSDTHVSLQSPSRNIGLRTSEVGGSPTAEVFARGVSGAFIAQLRDMLARMDELGVTAKHEAELLARLGEGRTRLAEQWRLAFALRAEYIAMLGETYAHDYRLDASYLLVAGANAIPQLARGETLPELLVVDDFQDTTLAGLRFLESLHEAGVRLLLVGNPDEAVQTFRGSYPEYLFRRAQDGDIHARMCDASALPSAGAAARVRATVAEGVSAAGDMSATDDASAAENEGMAGASGPRYLDVVASRISLSIPSQEHDPVPIAQRPGKLLQTAAGGASPVADGSLETSLYRSPREELDDVVWQIKRARLDEDVTWNDMAVIAHDNSIVRRFGERLRREGVPVRYSSVARPLKDEPFVQGLFALVELADLRRQGEDRNRMGLVRTAAFVRSRVATILASPLVSAAGGRPARLAPIESAIVALDSLSGIVTDDDAAVSRLVEAWGRLRSHVEEARREQADTLSSSISVDDALVDELAARGDDLAFGADAVYVMLAFDSELAPAELVMDAIQAVLGTDAQSKAFSRLWQLVAAIVRGMDSLSAAGPTRRLEPQYVLAVAWNATGVAKQWQNLALSNTPEGRAANDRLDAAMRLFQFAEGSSMDVTGFIANMRSQQIEADSLAHIGPVEEAVTLTTPAGAAGRHFRYVWLPSMQQDVWPNLAERNTMFAGEDLVELVLRGRLVEVTQGERDPRLVSVLSGEKKSLLVALTRADERATVSAVWNDDSSPSDFLFGYMPERFKRERSNARYTTANDHGDFSGLDASARGLVAAARIMLATNKPESDAAKDAIDTLALLAEHGVDVADPAQWPFVASGLGGDDDTTDDGTAESDATSSDPGDGPAHAADVDIDVDVDARTGARDLSSERPVVVSLSPSSADQLWACPVCWLLENRFSGPRPGSLAMGFGSLIHEVAQRGSEEGLDRSRLSAEAIAGRLEEIYESLRPDPDAIADVKERYQAMKTAMSANEILANIAHYFADSENAEYLGGNAKLLEIGRLEHVSNECEFSALFDLNDILAAYNAVPGIEPLNRPQLYAAMGMLVGGWPEGMRENLTVRLAGRIDRMETRVLSDGSRHLRLVDYKTGKDRGGPGIFNDLQLVCYQLGLAFPEGGPRGYEAVRNVPRIGQSVLFYVRHRSSAGFAQAPEGGFQPPLFVDGSLNAEPPLKRYRIPNVVEKLMDMPVPTPDAKPEGIPDEKWARFVTLAGTQTLWALTMIARVFYAAAAKRSGALIAHPQPSHLEYCKSRTCPACAGMVDTVFETRQA
ncbi:PD-(D/E)XK nuclease family protein [Bifidobacterium lemurum]|nr:PD-(D/E)XK nuclease family protein [Bifidobacterium lemurum]QOL35331.1 PD-(D/E)XK nuclease family protein [Bifidobacterium lemurum]